MDAKKTNIMLTKMTLDLIEVKPRLNVKKVVIITIVLILIISLISTAIFFGVRQYNKNLSIIAVSYTHLIGGKKLGTKMC